MQRHKDLNIMKRKKREIDVRSLGISPFAKARKSVAQAARMLRFVFSFLKHILPPHEVFPLLDLETETSPTGITRCIPGLEEKHEPPPPLRAPITYYIGFFVLMSPLKSISN